LAVLSLSLTISVAQAGSSYQFNQNLTLGSSGPDVSALQQILINQGYLTSASAPTGYFGSGTKTALEKLQTANDISPASGYLGPTTRAFLNSSGTSSSANQSSNISSSAGNNLSPSVISQIEPSIVLVVCFPPDYSTSGNFDYGSGVSVNNDGTTYIETNYHVYNEENTGGGSPDCDAFYPESPDFSINPNTGGYQLALSSSHYDPDTYEDAADFALGAPLASSTPLNSIPVINNTPLTGIGLGCSDASTGDNVTIFGYPASGNYLELSETVTQGTIAGINSGPIYKFDGTIDHGNSGGLAVLNNESCDLGIPTLGVSGLTGGTGYIQSVNLERQPVTESNDQKCQDSYGANSNYSGQSNNQGGLICSCASGYTWNAENTACVAESGDQVCNDDFPNSTWDGTYGSNGQYSCGCPDGYVWNNNQTACVVQPSCPANESYNSATNSCFCPVGYSIYGGQCISSYAYCTDTEGYGASYDAATNSCACDAGYTYNGSQCVMNSLYCSERWGVGAEYDYSTGGCACGYGYESNGSSCVYVGYNY
jgi:peptidoglycan hydrolase-like protein with peptidoglycan-binding domain